MQPLSEEVFVSEKEYRINEIFYSLQGEGVRAGTPNVFIRFSGCNLACDIEPGPRSPGQFACDTEFESGVWMDAGEILRKVRQLAPDCRSVIWTGGEPGLQLGQPLVDLFKSEKYFQAIETNGSVALPTGLDWICCSPKVAEHALKLEAASEVKYVRNSHTGIPKPRIKADHYLISPAFEPGGRPSPDTLAWCISLCLANPPWRLSLQLHKIWNVR